MNKNDSFIVVHNYIDTLSDVKFITMICFVVLAIVIVLILAILLIVVIYLLFKKHKHDIPTTREPRNDPQTSRRGSMHAASKTHSRNSLASGNNPAVSLGDDDTDINSNIQNIPMSELKSQLENHYEDLSESSAGDGLCEVLYPVQQQQGEVVYEPPPKLFAFAGQIFESARRPSKDPRRDSRRCRSQPGPSTSTRQLLNPELHNSLEWDYYESRHYDASNASDGSETSVKNTVNVCWV